MITYIQRKDPSSPILFSSGRTSIGIKAGTVIEVDGVSHTFDVDTLVATIGELVPGSDYSVGIGGDGTPFAGLTGDANPLGAGFFAGFHFAPGGCAEDRAGGDATPAINPYSLWDLGFRPSCPDPRGMAMIEMAGRRLWADIYLLGTDHLKHGTSRCGATIADGCDLPVQPSGKGKVKKLDYATATDIYAHHSKRLLGAEEFFAVAYGVKERCSRDNEPTITGEMIHSAARFISKHGLFDATGTMWQWGTDGDPDDPRPSIFGGSWINGSSAGSRYASLDYWPEFSNVGISARGACDHLSPV